MLQPQCRSGHGTEQDTVPPGNRAPQPGERNHSQAGILLICTCHRVHLTFDIRVGGGHATGAVLYRLNGSRAHAQEPVGHQPGRKGNMKGFLHNLQNIRIGRKIGGMVGILVLLTAIVAVYGLYALTHIGGEVEGVALEDVPISVALNRIARQQAEQVHSVELIKHYSDVKLAEQHGGMVHIDEDFWAELLEDARDDLDESRRVIDESFQEVTRIHEGTAMVDEDMEHEEDSLLDVVGQANRSYNIYSELLAEMRAHFETGNYEEVLSHQEEIEEAEHLLAASLREIADGYSTHSARTAMEAHEETDAARTPMATVGLSALLAGIAIGMVVSRAITVPIARASTAAQAIAEGNRDMDLSTEAEDETGRLLQAMDHMVKSIAQAEEETRQAQAEVEEQYRRNAEASQAMREQAELILEMGTPVIQLWEGVLVSPMVGTIDTDRANQLIETILRQIQETGAEVVILDLTGVPVVDTSVARNLLRTVDASRILGAEVVITGFSPEAAQTLSQLGVDFSMLRTKGTLQAGVVDAFDLIKVKISA